MIADRLTSSATRDLVTRERLANDGSLFDGYHPEMQAVHEENAAMLDDIIKKHGWPTSDLVGKEGADAAWLIVQHAIALPQFQRDCLVLLQEEAVAGSIPPCQPAMLLDRILVFEGKPQIYGTSFDWDEAGLMSPCAIADPDLVDERRAAVGLPRLAETIARHRLAAEGQPRPADPTKRQREMDEWARSVGWR